MVTESEKEDIRNRLPLEDVIREYNVSLLRAGRGYKALCPFHSEKTPSFHVNIEGQYFHCFGCEERGDVFSFVQKIEHVDFPQAVDLLARRAGVTLRGGQFSGERARRENIGDLYEALTFARDFYHQYLLREPAAHAARQYLLEREIEHSSWETFGLGYSPPEGRTFLSAATRKGFSPEILEKAGLVMPARSSSRASGGYDYFRGRIMFPITGTNRRTAGFGARILASGQERGPKYLNSPKCPVFDKSRLLYGLAESREAIQKEGRIAVVEGYTDVIMAHQAGLRYFVASLGTAFTEENARQLSRVGSGAKVRMVFDGDAAGQKAAERSLEVLVPLDLDVRVFTVPDGADPCEFIRASGAEALQNRMDSEAVSLFEFKWKRALSSFGDSAEGSSPAGRADLSPVARGRALDDCLKLLARVPNPITQKLLLREFSERIGLDEKDVAARFRKLTRSRSHPIRESQDPPRHNSDLRSREGSGEGSSEPSETVAQPTGVRALRRVILECIIAMPHNAADMWSQVPWMLFQGEATGELAAAIERQLDAGQFSPERLVREVQNADVQRGLIEILDRVRTEDDEGAGESRDYTEVWGYALRDIRRYLIAREIAELSSQIDRAKRDGETEAYRELCRARIQTKKKLKLMNRPDTGTAGADAG